MAMDASGGERRGEEPDWCVHEATLDEIDCLYGEHPDWHRRCVVFLLGALEAKVSEMNVGNRVCFETAKAYHIGGSGRSADLALCKHMLVRIQRGKDLRQKQLAKVIWPGMFAECADSDWEYPSYVVAEYDSCLCEIGVPCVVIRAALKAAFPGLGKRR